MSWQASRTSSAILATLERNGGQLEEIALPIPDAGADGKFIISDLRTVDGFPLLMLVGEWIPSWLADGHQQLLADASALHHTTCPWTHLTELTKEEALLMLDPPSQQIAGDYRGC